MVTNSWFSGAYPNHLTQTNCYRLQWKVMFSQACVILYTIGLMVTRSLLILVMIWLVRILLECFLVFLSWWVFVKIWVACRFCIPNLMSLVPHVSATGFPEVILWENYLRLRNVRCDGDFPYSFKSPYLFSPLPDYFYWATDHLYQKQFFSGQKCVLRSCIRSFHYRLVYDNVHWRIQGGGIKNKHPPCWSKLFHYPP